MATSTAYRNGTTYYTVEVTASIASQTDTHVTVSWSSKVTFGDWYYWGVGLRTYVNGSLVGHETGYTTSSHGTCCVSSGTVSIPKAAASRGVSFSASTYSTEVSGYGGISTTTEASGTVSVPAAGTPSPVARLAVERISDLETRLSWTNASSASSPYSSIAIERSVNGGGWTKLTGVSGSATSYSDRTTSPNASYAYRVRSSNGVNVSSWSVSATTWNTPAAPSFVSMSRNAGTVTATLDNPARTAEGLRWQRTKTPGDERSWSAAVTVAGTVKSFNDTPADGTWYYRAQNYRGSLASKWAVSDPIVNMCAPAAPTPVSPLSSIRASDKSIVFTWRHNPLDGSLQSAYEFAYSTNGGSTWQTVPSSASRAQSHTLANTFQLGAAIAWKVRTKGSHRDWSPWSAVSSATVVQAPSVSIESPGATIDRVPVTVKLAYADASGVLAAARVGIWDGEREVWSKDLGTGLSATVTAADWFPDEKPYTLKAVARSSTSLTASAELAFTVKFAKPEPGTADIIENHGSGTVGIVVGVEKDPAYAPVTGIDVYRVHAGNRVTLAQNVPEGTHVDDPMPPVNADYEYEIVTHSALGSVNRVVIPAKFASPWWYLASEGGTVAKGKWNPTYSTSVARPSKTRVWFAGRKWPVSYDDASHMAQTANFSCTLETAEEAEAFKRIVEEGGRGVFRGGTGDVFRCDIEVTLVPDLSNVPWWGTADVSLVRIDGGAL